MPDCPPLTAEELAELIGTSRGATRYLSRHIAERRLPTLLVRVTDALASLVTERESLLATLVAKEAELAAWESAVEEMRAHLAAAVGSGEGTSTSHEGSES